MSLEDVERHVAQVRLARMVTAGLEIIADDQQEQAEPQTCGCGHTGPDVLRRRKNTAYVDDSENWITCCAKCFQEVVDYYEDLWQEYYNR